MGISEFIFASSWFLICAAVAAMLYRRHVAAQQDAMLGLAAAAVDRNMPLQLAFAAMGNERKGWISQQADIVAKLMASGKSLPESLKTMPTVLSAEALPLVSIGCASGLLAPALRRVVVSRNAASMVWQSLVARAVYLLHLPAVFVGIIGYMVILRAPEIEKIFKDFGVKLPDLTRIAFGCLRNLEVVVPLVLFAATAWLIMYYALLRISGAIHWDLPGFGRFTRRLDRATVLDALSLAAAGQRPLPETVGLLAETYPKKAIRRRLKKALVAIEQGQDGFECLKRCGLLGAVDLAVLRAALRNGNLAWAAQEMADSNRRRFQYVTIAWMQTIFPAVILVLACIVGFVAVAMFMPLVTLILSLSGAKL